MGSPGKPERTAPTGAFADLRRANRRRRAVDAIARWVVGAGGMATIASILAIVVFIVAEVYPLWRAPRAQQTSRFSLPAGERLLAPGVDEYRKILSGVSGRGTARFVDLDTGDLLREEPIPGLSGPPVVAARSGRDHVALATADGRLVAVRLAFDVTFGERSRSVVPRVVERGSWPIAGEGLAPTILGATEPGAEGITVVFAGADGKVRLYAVREKKNLFGAVQRTESRADLPLPDGVAPTSIFVDRRGASAYVADAAGGLHAWDLRNPQAPRLVDAADTTDEPDVGVTAMGFLLGDRSLVVGDARGRVSVWFLVRDATRASGWRLQRAHEFDPHHAAVTAVAASPRDMSFLTADAAGRLMLRYSTTARTLLAWDSPGPVADLAFAPKANGAIALSTGSELVSWRIRNPHPEITLRSLLGKVWYEGYEEPAYVWQSTGGTDDFEPKLSLVPLAFGTIKGTLYALLFAVPLAVFAAIYTSQFSHPTIRNFVKPVVEIMAALPSVVLGFLAGLWLAPTIEPYVPGVLAMVFVVPSLIFAFGLAWHSLPRGVRSWATPAVELTALVALVLIGAKLSIWLNHPLENLFFGGDFRRWLQSEAGLRFDQRNCLIVGFAMGFAVIPLIFTICEDALSNVPRRLVSASLALGATNWQTAIRVVLPTASPGIFSAIMIGFGRAVGETMIVLMATGNTPILEWNIFTGMRTLSANIAVEIPEAPYASTLYRVLFLTALLLFLATFLVNTIADVVRARLREKYQHL